MATQTHARRQTSVHLLVALLAGAAVSVALGVYGHEHTPTGRSITTFGFSNLITMKVWLGLVVGGLAVVQLATALWMYGRPGGTVPRHLPTVHRVSGALAVLVSLPVAYHCLWSLGYQTYSSRVMWHSLGGCLFYGAVVTKVFALHDRRMPGWLVAVAGGAVLTVVVVVVWTSSIWYVRTIGWPGSSTGY